MSFGRCDGSRVAYDSDVHIGFFVHMARRDRPKDKDRRHVRVVPKRLVYPTGDLAPPFEQGVGFSRAWQ